MLHNSRRSRFIYDETLTQKEETTPIQSEEDIPKTNKRKKRMDLF